MEMIKKKNKSRKAEYVGFKPTTKEDLRYLLNRESSTKYEMEKSSEYLGYKTRWIIKIALDGRKFPTGELNED